MYIQFFKVADKTVHCENHSRREAVWCGKISTTGIEHPMCAECTERAEGAAGAAQVSVEYIDTENKGKIEVPLLS